MERTPVKNDFARTSTPRYPLCDSGFHGSEIKSPSYPFYAFSPIKESPFGFKEDELPFSRSSYVTFTPLKFHYNSAYDSNQNSIRIEKSDVIKQLSFEDSGISNESDNYQVKHPRRISWIERAKIRSGTSSLSPSQIQSRKVNILSQLERMNCRRVISDLLSYLPAEDLCRASCVNKMWKDLILEDVKANGRRREYLKSIRSHRENRSRSGISPAEIKKRYERLSCLPKLVLNDITNSVQDSKVSTKCCDSKFDSFLMEGNNVGGPLMKCPSCKYAARRKGEDEFICTKCNYNFCKKCLFAYSRYHKCPMLEVPTLIIGSQRCKKNLKRL